MVHIYLFSKKFGQIKVIENLSSLKGVVEDFSRVSVCIDRNEDGRKVMKELVQRAKQQTNESTDKKYIVCGAYLPYIREMNKLRWSYNRPGVYIKMRLFYTNCDCLTKSKINYLECSNKLINPSIICLTVVLPKNRKLGYNKEMYNLTGYVIVDSLLKGRGICLYCKPEFIYNVIKNISEFEEAVACEFIGQTKILLLVISDRSPNSTSCNDQKLFDLLMDLAQINYNKVFIVGDFNYCTIDWNLRVIRSHSESATHFMTTMNELYLEQLVSEPIRYRVGQKENILDLVLTNNLYFVESVDYCDPLGMSDHVSLLIILNHHIFPNYPRECITMAIIS